MKTGELIEANASAFQNRHRHPGAFSELTTGEFVVPTQAGIHPEALDSRVRANDDPKIKV